MADAVVLDSRGQLVGRTRTRRYRVRAAEQAELPVSDFSLGQGFVWRGCQSQDSPDCPGRVGEERGLPAFGEDRLVDGLGFHGGFNAAGGTQGKCAPHAMVLDFHRPALDGAKPVAAGVRVLEDSPPPKARGLGSRGRPGPLTWTLLGHYAKCSSRRRDLQVTHWVSNPQ